MANADMDNRSQPNLAVTLVAFESGNEGVEHGDRRVWGSLTAAIDPSSSFRVWHLQRSIAQ
jgi:hypothetical protein